MSEEKKPQKKKKGKLNNIVSGWKNVFVPDEEVEKVAIQRLAICEDCPHKKLMVCTLCGCPLKAKSRAMDDSCPDGRWDVYDLENS